MIAATASLALVAQPRATLVNPLLPSGPDPWVTYRNGFYYYMNTTPDRLAIRKTRDIADLKDAPPKVVWKAPASGPYSHDVWAPELHWIDGKWYIYFAADAGSNDSHRMWVLENASEDPLEGEWIMKGKLSDASDKWAIDPTVFEQRGRLYVAWSGWEGDRNGEQDIYTARLKNPWTIEGARVRISRPEYAWEKIGDLKDSVRHVDVNEGPEFLERNGKIFLVYSASGCWTNNYALGMLTASANSDLLDPSSWKKSPRPVFEQDPAAHAFGTGHCSFFKSPDGGEDWIVYHANPEANQGCGSHRSPRAQPFTWRRDGTPDFGKPVAVGEAIPAP